MLLSSRRLKFTALKPMTVLLLCAIMTGCGFQLRGAQVLPAGQNKLYFQGPGDLRQEIMVFLDGSDTHLVRTVAAADVILQVDQRRYDRRVLSVDPITGKEREFELSLTVRYSARRADGTTLLTPQDLTLLRDYVFDSDAVIGKSREEHVLLTEMLRDAVQQLLARLQSVATGA